MTVELANNRVVAARVEMLPSLRAAPVSALKPAWGLWSSLCVIAALVTALFGERFLELSVVWLNDENYSHGFLVPVVSAYLAWRGFREGEWTFAPVLVLGLAWFALGCFLHLAAVVVWLPPIDFVSLSCLLYGLALAGAGRGLARELLFPILFLSFMFPLPVALTDRAAVWLQMIVATLSTQILQLFVPVYQEGNFIHLPGQQLEVGEACSGLRQVVAFTALTLLVVHLSKRSFVYKAALVVSGFPVAVTANLARVLVMAVVMTYAGTKWVEGPYHAAWGLVTMAGGLGLLALVNWWLSRLLSETNGNDQVAAAGAHEPLLDAESNGPSTVARGGGSTRLRGLVACSCLTLLGQVLLQNHLRAGELETPPSLQRPLTGFPVSLGAWTGQETQPATLPYFYQADDKLSRIYTREEAPGPGLPCHVWMIHFLDGRDREHHPVICYKVGGFAEELSAQASMHRPGRKAPIERFCFIRNGSRSYVYYWHYTFEPPANPDTTLMQLIHQRRGRLLPSLTVEVLATPQNTQQLAELDRFVELVDGQLRAFVPPSARMGSDILPIRYTGAPRLGPPK